MQIYHLHPAIVHVPIAYLAAAVVAQALSLARPRRQGGAGAEAALPTGRCAMASAWLLPTGTIALWVAAALGLLAERTAPHVPPAWEVLHTHRTLGLWSAVVFTVLTAAQLLLRGRLARVRLAVGIVALALLLGTAYRGGELVYVFGMGVAAR